MYAPRAAFAQPTYEVLGRMPLKNWGVPRGPLLRAPDGSLRGTTSNGGAFSQGGALSDQGSVFTLVTDGGAGFTAHELHSFSGPDGKTPLQGLVLASTGLYYGTTNAGGRAGAGTIFSLDEAGRLTVLHDFADDGGRTPSALAEGADGRFYGIAAVGGAYGLGTLFRIAPSGDFEVLYEFSGISGEGYLPGAGLALGPDGRMWGTTGYGGTYNQGTVYAVDTSGAIAVLHSFTGSDGAHPAASLVAAAGDLFGTTINGGTSGRGTVYRLSTSGTVTTLYSFTGNSDGVYPSGSLVFASDGNLYGWTSFYSTEFPPTYFLATIFRLPPAGGLATIYTFPDPTSPLASFVEGPDGSLYCSASVFPAFEPGTILRIELDGTVSTAFVFGTEDTPCCSNSNLVELPDGNLYSVFGGRQSSAIVRVNPSGDFSTFFTFDPGKYANPYLTAGSDANLYGSTPDGFGTVYRVDPSGTLTTLHSFSGSDGAQPIGGLAEGPGPEFWGVTAAGGGADHGVVFKLDAKGTFAAIHELGNGDGISPSAGLMRGGDGSFYGVTQAGGDNSSGTAFRVDALGGFVTLHSFGASPLDGVDPESSLLPASDGYFYGTTVSGGANLFGTIFRTDSQGNVTTIHAFDQPSVAGPAPSPALIENAPGDFYGDLQLVYGEVIRVDAAGSVTPVHDFTGFPEPYYPTTPLVKATDGSLYGAATADVYRILPQAVAPFISSLEPSSGRAAGGGSVAVHGHHFRDAVTATFGGVDGTAVYFERESLFVTLAPALAPGALYDVTVTNADATTTTLPAGWFADFVDVTGSHRFHDFIETIFRHGITAGCGSASYCPDSAVTRAQMAVFLLKSEHGSEYAPPPCVGHFADVACPSLFADWIEQLAAEDSPSDAEAAATVHRTPVAPRSDGGLPAQGRARLGLPAASLSGSLRRCRVPLALRRLDRATFGRGDHGRLRRRQLLPVGHGHSRPDGGVPHEDLQPAVAGGSAPR